MGAPGGIPDIGVRLTASGVQDVVNAFRQVRQEAADAKEGGIDILGTAMEQLGDLLPVLTLGLFVDKVVEAGTAALESADQMGKLSEKTGISAGTLSVLGLAAKETDTDQELLSKGLVKLAASMQNASDGVAKPKKAFADLGISMADLKTKDPGQIFVEVAEKLQGIESPALRAQILIALFGKAGVELLPVMNQVAEEGFGNLEAKAKSLGIYLSDDLVDQIKQAKATLADLSAVGQGAALQFVAGLLPAITGIAQALTGMAGDTGFFDWGVNVGHQVLLIAADFAFLVKHVQQTRAELIEVYALAKMAIDGPDSHLDWTKAQRDAAASAYDADKAMLKEASDLNKQAAADFTATDAVLATADLNLGGHSMAKKKMSVTGATGDGGGKDKSDAIAAAQLAYQKSLDDNLLTIQKAANAAAEAEDKRRYDEGLITVDQYYDNVQLRIIANNVQELADLQAKYDAEAAAKPKDEAARIKQQQDLAKISTQMTVVDIQLDKDLAAADDARFKANAAASLKALEDKKALQTASGDAAGAQKTALQIELQQYDDLLKKVGQLTDIERAQAVADYATKATAKIGFNSAQQQGNAGLAGMNEDIKGIQDQAANGSISNVAAEAQILNLEQTRLATLQDIGSVMTLNALVSEDPKLIADAQKYNDSLDVMVSKLKNVTTAQTELTNQLTGQGYTDLVNFFQAGISGSKSWVSALQDMGSQFEGIVSKMISQLLVYYAMMELVGWIAPNSSFATSLASSGPFGKGFAGGGYTGDGSAGQIAGVVHGQEYVFNAATTKANRQLFDMIAAGQMPPIISPAAMASVSTGYAATVAQHDAANPPAAGNITLNVVDGSGQKASASTSTGTDGSQMITVLLGEVAKNIRSNGVVGQSLTATYAVQRQGVRRG